MSKLAQIVNENACISELYFAMKQLMSTVQAEGKFLQLTCEFQFGF